MANPGQIHVAATERQLIFTAPKGNSRWLRITNAGPGLMGITYDSDDGASLSVRIEKGRSMDLVALKVEIRNDGGGDVDGVYDALP